MAAVQAYAANFKGPLLAHMHGRMRCLSTRCKPNVQLLSMALLKLSQYGQLGVNRCIHLIRHEAQMSARHIVPHLARNESRGLGPSRPPAANLETASHSPTKTVTFNNGLFDNQKMRSMFTFWSSN